MDCIRILAQHKYCCSYQASISVFVESYNHNMRFTLRSQKICITRRTRTLPDRAGRDNTAREIDDLTAHDREALAFVDPVEDGLSACKRWRANS
jgi:hypothetical protein